MGDNNQIQVVVKDYEGKLSQDNKSNQVIYDFDSQIDLCSNDLDMLDYLVSISAGVLSGLIDVFWVDEFNLENSRNIASKEVDKFVTDVAKMTGWNGDNFLSAVRHLEKNYHIPSDGLTPRFGGGLHHHLRDFAHHPTMVGLVFSILTQFTYKSYGTDEIGNFIIVDVPEYCLEFIGNDTPTKLLYGVIYWFIHLISDMAGSSGSIMKNGGTGIPGPILSLAKELSILPIFKDLKVEDKSLSLFISKLFNGTLLAKHDVNGLIIKDTQLRFDFRAEIGLGIEIGKMALPVMANEGIVRLFYMFRRLAIQIKENNISNIDDFKKINWDYVKPINNPTLARMLTISTGVFTAIDLIDASNKDNVVLYVNAIGIGRFAVAIGQDISWSLKARDAKKAKKIYKDIKEMAEFRNKTLMMSFDYLNLEKFSLNIEQTEILYNLEYFKTLNDINTTNLSLKNDKLIKIKKDWLSEWKEYITNGFPSFVHQEININWYTEQEMFNKILINNPKDVWFRLLIIETMIFEPYFPLSIEIDDKGKPIISEKYKVLQKIDNGFNKEAGDDYLNSKFNTKFFKKDFIKRSRNSYDKYIFDLNQVLYNAVKNISISGVVSVATMIAASMFAPAIAVYIVGSNFIGLSGAALTSASLAYLGGGAIAVGGLGMAGGTITIIGGGAALGMGIGTGIKGVLGSAELVSKQNLIQQSAKLLVSVNEVLIMDEHDLTYVNEIYNTYIKRVIELKREIFDLKLEAKYNKVNVTKELTNKFRNFNDSLKVTENVLKILKNILIKKKYKIT